jgi:hypothetical protein
VPDAAKGRIFLPRRIPPCALRSIYAAVNPSSHGLPGANREVTVWRVPTAHLRARRFTRQKRGDRSFDDTVDSSARDAGRANNPLFVVNPASLTALRFTRTNRDATEYSSRDAATQRFVSGATASWAAQARTGR